MHPGYSPWAQFWSNNVTRKLHKCIAFCSPFVPKMGRAYVSGDPVFGGWLTMDSHFSICVLMHEMWTLHLEHSLSIWGHSCGLIWGPRLSSQLCSHSANALRVQKKVMIQARYNERLGSGGLPAPIIKLHIHFTG